MKKEPRKLKTSTKPLSRGVEKGKKKGTPKILRIPRPIGITLLARSYNKSNDTNLLSTLYNKIIGQYIQSGFQVNGVSMNMSQLALYLGLPLQNLMKKVHQQIQVFGQLGEGKNLETMGSALKVCLFNGALEARQIANQQVTLMMKAQDGKYVPFVSTTVNGAIGNLFKADINLQGVYNTLFKEANTSININNNPTTNNAFLTPEKAVQILIDKGNNGLIKKPEMVEALRIEKALQDPHLPEVVATRQQGFQADSIPTLKPITNTIAIHAERNEVDGDILDGDEI